MILTAQEAEKMLAAPCGLILVGAARPTFPGTDRCSPAPFVLIRLVCRSKTGGISTQGLPVSVRRDQWETCVLPVLEDVSLDFNHPLNRGKGIQDYQRRIGLALRESFRSQGW